MIITSDFIGVSGTVDLISQRLSSDRTTCLSAEDEDTFLSGNSVASEVRRSDNK